MSPTTVAWLETREPRAPEDLRRRVAEAVAGGRDGSVGDTHGMAAPGAEADARVRILVDAARERLARARSRPGRVRDGAFELLVADALVTFACEAALESRDPTEALAAVLEVGEP